MPQVSVVIPTAGRPELVVQAVASVLAQTAGDLEAIVVIDGPDAATEAALAGFADPRLRVVANPERRHVSATRNIGVALATAPWVAFLDDDDRWEPDKLTRQLALAPRADGSDDVIVMTLSRVVTPSGDYVWPRKVYDNRQPIDEYLFDKSSWFKGHSFVQSSSLMAPRRMFETVRFADIRQHEDWDLVIRAVKQRGYRLLTVPEPLVVHAAEQAGPRLSNELAWKQSLDWLDGLGALITPRAYSGFCLTVIGAQPAAQHQYGALAELLGRAVRRGSPTPRQLAAFAATWLVPLAARRGVRRLVLRARG